MDRRSFLKSLGIFTGAVLIAPIVIFNAQPQTGAVNLPLDDYDKIMREMIWGDVILKNYFESGNNPLFRLSSKPVLNSNSKSRYF